MLTHRGECFCGAVRIEVAGEPEGMGYRHCASCRSWSAAPVNAFTLWKPEAVRITQGSEKIGMFQKTPLGQRQYCRACGGHLLTNHPFLGLGMCIRADLAVQTVPSHQLRRDGSADA